MPRMQPIPNTSPVLDGPYIGDDWFAYFDERDQRLNGASSILGSPVSLPAQTGAIGTTAIPLPSLTTGLYKLNYWMRVTVPASINSSLALTIAGTSETQSFTITSPALTSNSVSLPASGVIPLFLDGGSSLSYSTTYASNAAGMQYRLVLWLEQGQSLS